MTWNIKLACSDTTHTSTNSMSYSDINTHDVSASSELTEARKGHLLWSTSDSFFCFCPLSMEILLQQCYFQSACPETLISIWVCKHKFVNENQCKRLKYVILFSVKTCKYSSRGWKRKLLTLVSDIPQLDVFICVKSAHISDLHMHATLVHKVFVILTDTLL